MVVVVEEEVVELVELVELKVVLQVELEVELEVEDDDEEEEEKMVVVEMEMEVEVELQPPSPPALLPPSRVAKPHASLPVFKDCILGTTRQVSLLLSSVPPILCSVNFCR